ncbi:hypothetical protein Plhal703r1_c18g0082131 [Plasmopara halstedii]
MIWRAAMRVLRYWEETSAIVIRFVKSSEQPSGLKTSSDANWGGDQAMRRSTSGFLVLNVMLHLCTRA